MRIVAGVIQLLCANLFKDPKKLGGGNPPDYSIGKRKKIIWSFDNEKLEGKYRSWSFDYSNR